MKSFILIAAVVLVLAGCTRTERNIAGGAAIGGGLGLLATGNSGGALVGATAGGVLGALVSRDRRRNRCYYRKRNRFGRFYGRTVVRRCY